MKLPHLECLRCSCKHCDGAGCEHCNQTGHHTWIPRQPKPPVACPRCKNPYYNRPRKGD